MKCDFLETQQSASCLYLYSKLVVTQHSLQVSASLDLIYWFYWVHNIYLFLFSRLTTTVISAVGSFQIEQIWSCCFLYDYCQMKHLHSHHSLTGENECPTNHNDNSLQGLKRILRGKNKDTMFYFVCNCQTVWTVLCLFPISYQYTASISNSASFPFCLLLNSSFCLC